METDEGGEGEGEVEFAEVVLEGGTLGVEVLAFEDAVMNRALHRTLVAMTVPVLERMKGELFVEQFPRRRRSRTTWRWRGRPE